MKEEEVWAIFNDWLDKNRFRGGVWLKPTKDDVASSFRPDFVVMAKGRKRRKIAVETKGSKFRLQDLLGQLLVYHACYSETWAVLPLEKAKQLVETRKLIQRKIIFNFEIFGVTPDTIFRYDETLTSFVNAKVRNGVWEN